MNARMQALRRLISESKRLLSGDWDRDLAGRLFEVAEQIGEQFSDERSASLGEATLGYSAYLSSFVESLVGPNASQRVQLAALLEELADSANRLAPEAPEAAAPAAPKPGKPAAPAPAAAVAAPAVQAAPAPLVVLVDPSAQEAGLLEPLLALSGHALRAVTRVDRSIVQQMSDPQVRALVIPAAALDVWEKLIKLEPGLDEAQRRVSLFVTAREDDLGLRLKASRAGADGYFVLPGARERLAREIAEVLAERVRPFHALIVDDDASMTLFFDSVLRKAGLSTRVVNDSTKAPTALVDFVPDVILLDLHMPGMSGLDLLTVFRAHPKTAFTPVVLISGDDDEERRFDTLTAGGDDFLRKPIRPKHLVAAVRGRAQRARWLRRALREAMG